MHIYQKFIFFSSLFTDLENGQCVLQYKLHTTTKQCGLELILLGSVCYKSTDMLNVKDIRKKSFTSTLRSPKNKQTKKGDIYQFRLLLSARWSPLAVNSTYCQALCQEMLGREVAVPPAEVMPHPQNPFLCQILLSTQENSNVTGKNSSVEKSFTRQDCAGVDKNKKTWLVPITNYVCQRAPPSSWKLHVLTKSPLRHHFRREN